MAPDFNRSLPAAPLKLREQIKQDQFSSAGHEAMLNVIVTASWVLNELNAVMAPFGITPAQYNVLRILRGSAPEKLTCSDVGSRLLERTPDVTRLLNRLEGSNLVTRVRCENDRRVVHVGISEEGVDLLNRMNPVVQARQEKMMDALTAEEQHALSHLLDRLRTP